MSRTERALNWLLGLSVISWAVLGPVSADPAARLTVVRLAVSAVNLLVGVLLILRAPVIANGSWGAIGASLPGLAVAGVALGAAPAPQLWSPVAQGLFAAGAGLAVAAFLFLGRSFAILPALRRVVARGPYRVVRHPAYLGELLMVGACYLAGPSLIGGLAALAAPPLVVIRILAEERVLAGAADYRDYAARVRWRLIPPIW